jgi:uncharacterized damage-inducible protein DinB
MRQDSGAGKLLKSANGTLYARSPGASRYTRGSGTRRKVLDSYLQELYGHQEWADAEHWRAFEAHPPALEDKAIRERLLHIHLVQHGFLWVTGPRTEQFSMKKIEDFSTMADLKTYAQRGLAELREALKAFSSVQIEEVIEVPWFRPPARISRRQALTQAAMHSHYHRGQNATRLRELGGTPPMTDFIVWLKNGQPPAQWS